MKRTSLIRMLLAATVATIAIAGCKKEEKEAPENLLLAGIEDDDEAFAATLDVSEAAVEGPASFAPGSDNASFAGCTGTITGSDMISVCSRNVPSNRSITWSCTGAAGNGVSGSASVMTVVLDDTDCPNVTIQHEIAFSRTLVLGQYTGTLEGTSTVTLTLDSANRSAQRTVEANLTRQVHRGEELVRDQELTGIRVADLAANGAGLADDTRTVNGSATIEFKLAEATLDLDAANVLWVRGCCHPVGGTVDYVFSGGFDGDGTITYGPTCGEAYYEDQSEVGLSTCPAF